MNFNVIIALLELKGIISHDEAERLVEHISEKPQSTILSDSLAAVHALLNPPAPTAPLGPVGPAQLAEEQAARSIQNANPVPPAGQQATEFPTLPGAKESTGNDLSIDEMSETAKETNKTGNQESVVDSAKDSDNAPADKSEESPAMPKSEALASAVKKSPAKSSKK